MNLGLFVKTLDDGTFVERELSKSGRGANRRYGPQLSMAPVKLEQRLDVDVRHTVAVCRHEDRPVDIPLRGLHAPTRHCLGPSIDQPHPPPRFAVISVKLVYSIGSKFDHDVGMRQLIA